MLSFNAWMYDSSAGSRFLGGVQRFFLLLNAFGWYSSPSDSSLS